MFDNSTVMTPHAGEIQAVFGKPPSRDLKVCSSEVKAFASRSGGVVLLKGHTDVVSDGIRVKLNNTGNPGMTVGGTGDVLSGIVAGLMAQGIDSYRAAVAGRVHQRSRWRSSEEHFGYHLTPTDLLRTYPESWTTRCVTKPSLRRGLTIAARELASITPLRFCPFHLL